MTYQLKGDEEVRDGALFGWTGAKCEKCKGCGQDFNTDSFGRPCTGCGGTGEKWGRMPVQPPDLDAADSCGRDKGADFRKG